MATDIAPLSFSQESLWLTEEIVPGLTQYQMVAVFELGGPLDVTAVDRAIGVIVDRHELLRTRFGRVNGIPCLTVDGVSGGALSFVDLSAVSPGSASDGALAAIVGRWYRQPLDLGSPPLLRAEVVRLGPQKHLLILATHHIVGDEQSIGIVQRELFACYQAFAAGAEPDLPQLTVQYADYTAWQREQLEPELDDGLAYWAKRLSGLPAMLLPSDRPRPAARSFTCAWADADLDPAALDALQVLARDQGTSLFAVLLAAFDLLLARWTGSPEVVVGTPVAGRPDPELENLIGFFVNSVVLRARCEPDEPFADLLERVTRELAEDLGYEHVPFHRVVERVNPVRDRGRHPLYQTAFHIVALEGADSGVLGDLTITDRSDEFLRATGVTTEFDLVVQVVVADQRPQAHFQYAAELFSPSTMAELACQFGYLLTAIARDPAGVPALPTFPVPRLPVATAADRAPRPAPRAVDGVHAARVLAILCEELDLPRIGMEDDFFAAGGSSLIGSRVVQRLREELGVTVTLIDLFDVETIGELVQMCGVAPDTGTTAEPSHNNARLCVLNQLAGTSGGVFHAPIGLRLTGNVNVPALRAALADLAQRHEPLRTVHVPGEGGIKALVLETSAPDFAVERVPAGGLDLAMTHAAALPFDLSRQTPWRVRLFESDGQWRLLIVLHAVAADPWSTRPLLNDLTVAYSARVGGERPAWAPLPVRYSQYLAQHPELRAGRAGADGHATQLAYWLNTLSGLAPAGVPTDRPRTAQPAYAGDSIIFDVPPKVCAGLSALASRQRTNLFMVLLAAVAAVLTAQGAGTDLAIGCTVSGRGSRDLDSLVGSFANTLVLRIDTSGDPSFAGLLTRVRATSLAAFTNESLPFAVLMDQLAPGRLTWEQPAYRVALSLCTAPVVAAELDLPGARAELVEAGTGLVAQDLAFEFTELSQTGSGLLWGVVQYATELFDRATVQRLADRLQAVLAESASDLSSRAHR